MLDRIDQVQILKPTLSGRDKTTINRRVYPAEVILTNLSLNNTRATTLIHSSAGSRTNDDIPSPYDSQVHI